MINKRRIERTETMAKCVNKKSKTNKSRLQTQTATFSGRQPSFQVRDVVKRKLSRTNEETLSAIEEGRKIAADNDAPAYTTIEELKTVLEK